jgi:membrane fusion protein (multidrug efflux system)
MRKMLLIAVPVLVLALGGYGAWRWWQDWRFQQSTDDAYVQSDISVIAPTIEGTIKEVRVQDNERVTESQVLFVIDDADFVARLHQAEAAVSSQEAVIGTYSTRRELQLSIIEQAVAGLDAAEAEVTRSDLDEKRYVSLLSSDVATRQRFETAQADSRKASATVLRLKAVLAAERQQLAVLDSQKREDEAKLVQAKAALQLARNQLDDTIIRAPVAGVIGNRAGQIGQYVKPGSLLALLVPLPHVYVTANFKETQLTLMRPGQTAEISVDAYPDHLITGRVESFAPASGAQFSLLPPDNATGNFTKIVQRVPVRIALPVDGPLAPLLRPGLSVTVTINTKGASTAGQDAAAAEQAGTAQAGTLKSNQ